MRNRILWGLAIYFGAFLALFVACYFIYERDPALGMHVWNAGKSLLRLPWLILGKAIAAFIAMFSPTPGMIDATGDNQAINTVVVFAAFIAFFLFAVPAMWKKLVGGGGGGHAHGK